MSNTSEPSETFKQGIKIRREVLGDAYVDKALAGVRAIPLIPLEAAKEHGFYPDTKRLTATRVLIRLGNLDRNT